MCLLHTKFPLFFFSRLSHTDDGLYEIQELGKVKKKDILFFSTILTYSEETIELPSKYQ